MIRFPVTIHKDYCTNIVKVYEHDTDLMAICSNAKNEKFIAMYNLKGSESKEEIEIIKKFIIFTALRRKENNRRYRINSQISIVKQNLAMFKAIKWKNGGVSLIIDSNERHLKMLKNQLNNGAMNYIWKNLKEIEEQMT